MPNPHTDQTCENCKFFIARPTVNEELMQCMRYAPRPTVPLHRGPLYDIRPTIWPTVRPEDYCGEWAPVPPV